LFTTPRAPNDFPFARSFFFLFSYVFWPTIPPFYIFLLCRIILRATIRPASAARNHGAVCAVPLVIAAKATAAATFGAVIAPRLPIDLIPVAAHAPGAGLGDHVDEQDGERARNATAIIEQPNSDETRTEPS